MEKTLKFPLELGVGSGTLPEHVHHLGQIQLQRLQGQVHFGFQFTGQEQNNFIFEQSNAQYSSKCI